MLNSIETVNILLAFIVKPPLNLFFKHHLYNIPQIYKGSNIKIFLNLMFYTELNNKNII